MVVKELKVDFSARRKTNYIVQGGMKMNKKIILWLMIISLAMTATPIVILANKIRPFILGIPFFAFWNIFWPTMLFVLTIIYGRTVNE